MNRIRVDISVLNYATQSFTTMFHDVILEVDEASNRCMNQAFLTQHPRLASRIPSFRDGAATYRRAFECINVRDLRK